MEYGKRALIYKLFRSVQKLLCGLPINGAILDNRTVYILSYSNLTNIGDEIQSIASHDMLISLGYKIKYVERESLSRHFSLFKRRLILNGWFSHDPTSFPPSKSFVPVFIGFHLANTDILKDIASINYFKRYQKIGCRDFSTVDKLSALGIDAYYTGCPTLTLQTRLSPIKRGCLVVDAHLNNPDGHTSDARKILTDIIEKYKIQDIKYVTQNCDSGISTEEKTILAEARLAEISASSIVITNRIHVALPCLAMGTPVIFIHTNPISDPRIASFLPYFWFKTEVDELLPEVSDYSQIENKSEYEKDREFIQSKFTELLAT